MFISFSDSFIPYSAWYKLCPWMSLFKLLAQKRCEPRVMQKQASTTSPVLFCCHTNIEFLLKEGDVQLFHCHDSCGISSVCSCRTPSPIASGCRKKPSANPTKVFALRSIRYVFWLHQTRCDGKKKNGRCDSLQLLCSCCLFVGPYSTRSKLELKIATSTFEWEATTFCSYEIEQKAKQPKQAVHSHGHWLIDPFFCRSIGASSARGATVSPPPQPILFVLQSRMKNNCITSRNCPIRMWPSGVCFKRLFRSMFRAPLSRKTKTRNLDESLSPKSKIPAILKVGTSATKNYPPWN